MKLTNERLREIIQEEIKSLNEGYIKPNVAKKLSIGSTLKTQEHTYTITEFGNKANAFRQFEVEDENGDKYNIQVSLRGASDIQVAQGRSLNFPEKGEILEAYNTEDATMAFTDELNDEGITAEIFDAEGDGRSVKAQFTNKKWDDGVPVTKYLSRGGYKSVSTPRGGFRVIETSEFWYYEIDGGWAAVNRKKNGTPPFEY
jgi:hypothetical protein